MRIDKLDYKILFELDRDSRLPITDLAKKVRLSKDSVIYRIKRMETQGIILTYETYANSGKLGYINARINLRLQNTTLAIENEINKYILNQKFVTFFASVEGDIDLIIFVMVKSVNELNLFYNDLVSRYGNYINNKELGVYSKVIHFSRNYLVNEKSRSSFSFVSSDDKIDLDKLDYDLLQILSKNARTSIVDISKRLSISVKTASNRIKKLKEKQIITGSTISLDLDKLGVLYYKVCIDLKELNNDMTKKLDSFFASHPNVVYRDYVVCGHDCEVEIEVFKASELRTFINDVKDKFSNVIKDYSILHYYKLHRLSQQLLLER